MRKLAIALMLALPFFDATVPADDRTDVINAYVSAKLVAYKADLARKIKVNSPMISNETDLNNVSQKKNLLMLTWRMGKSVNTSTK